VPKSDVRTNEQIRAELAAERAALREALGQAREELKRSAKLVTSVPLALAGVTFVARRLFARWHGR
jgi:hypothetical protein